MVNRYKDLCTLLSLVVDSMPGNVAGKISTFDMCAYEFRRITAISKELSWEIEDLDCGSSITDDANGGDVIGWYWDKTGLIKFIAEEISEYLAPRYAKPSWLVFPRKKQDQ